MITVADALTRLDDVVAEGDLAALCRRRHVEIVMLFGSALTARSPGDIDLAVGFVHGAPRDFLSVIDDLAALVPGDHLDVMDLDRADPVAQRVAMFDGRVLFETAPEVTAERQMKAYSLYEDTRWLRRLQQESLLS